MEGHELRELRVELKAARSDVKRYASYALRLQQELAREKQKREECDTGDDFLVEEDARSPDWNEKYTETSTWDKAVGKSRKEHDAWSRQIAQVVQMLDGRRGEAVEGQEKGATHDNQVEERVETVVQLLGPFLQRQKRLIGEIGRENAKLRDMVRARPTRRALLTSQLEVERLQRSVQKLRARGDDAGGREARSDVPVQANVVENVAGGESSLSQRIMEERLLQMLRVNTENSATHHKYLKGKLRCYLSLDSARLAAKTQDLSEAGILERVGRICSDMVASCCYALEVEDVAELPSCVVKAHELARVSTTYQDFVERIDKLLKRFDKDAFYSIRAKSTAKTSCHEALEMHGMPRFQVLAHVNDMLVELDARRDQMKPPGSKAHEVLLAIMKLLQVPRIDQLAPTIRRLVDNMQAEQEFQRGLCELFGLDESANRRQILHVASVLFGELGFLTGNAPLRERSTASPTHPRS
ncbi:hypothetical protein PHYPSEUDO_001049 [Phytophthora pseudosyringae]|uniref:Centrosomal protein of 70 kDa n=1 Tax=Phytophthora pseudosyringae TaxID=221518 RepID=A0A8T1W1G1_9STRA|nr:hypothetical protein PHYPSEUDO_001049 [Phytophthora pseudosyringae]